jgi:hypothetical protein
MATCVADPSRKPTCNIVTNPREEGCVSSHTADRKEVQMVRGSSHKGDRALVNHVPCDGFYLSTTHQDLLALGSPSSIFVSLTGRALFGVVAPGLVPGPGPRERPTPRHQNTNTGPGRTCRSPPPGGRGRWRGGGAACARDQRAAPRPAAPRSGTPGLPGDFFRTGIVTQR